MIEALGQAISRTPGCTLLDVDAGASTNRTVYTFVGTPEAVVEGALSAARVAWELIDLSQHKGKHSQSKPDREIGTKVLPAGKHVFPALQDGC